jgi:putative transposase
VKKAKFAFVRDHAAEHPVSVMCKVLEVTRQGYYQWLSRPESAHEARDRELAAAISEQWEASRRIYGAPKLHAALARAGVRTSRKRVARLMRQAGMRGVTRACARRPSGEKRAARRDSAADLVRRDFSADGPDRAWFADITYVRTRQGWLYLAVVFDIWSRMVVGWAMGPGITAELADEALRMAVARRRPPEGCVHHSDHGSQYTSLLLGRAMEEFGIRPSMGSISSPWDNAPTESLMGIIKSECVHARTFESRELAALEIFDYIECFYNRVRIHSAIGWMSPAEFECVSSREVGQENH